MHSTHEAYLSVHNLYYEKKLHTKCTVKCVWTFSLSFGARRSHTEPHKTIVWSKKKVSYTRRCCSQQQRNKRKKITKTFAMSRRYTRETGSPGWLWPPHRSIDRSSVMPHYISSGLRRNRTNYGKIKKSSIRTHFFHQFHNKKAQNKKKITEKQKATLAKRMPFSIHARRMQILWIVFGSV